MPTEAEPQPGSYEQPAPVALHPDQPEESVKQTVILVIVALIIAFIFRSFLVEPFVIPTGSMAPTLLGAHTLQRNDANGNAWTVNVWDEPTVAVHDPVTHLPIDRPSQRIRAGDRILVLKHLYALREPRRWEVVVFKNPEGAGENFIKRLVGLPNEEVWVVDGDIFAREIEDDGSASQRWTIRRKPGHLQSSLWSTIFSSEWTPADPPADWQSPWIGDGWIRDGATRSFDSARPAYLSWDDVSWDDDGEAVWPIDDWVAYNDDPANRFLRKRFPTSDLRMRAGVEPFAASLSISALLQTRGHHFEGLIGADGAITLRMRADQSDDNAEQPWRVLAESRIDPLEPGKVANIAFAHVDQALELWVDGERVARAEYDWTAEDRLDRSLLESAEALGRFGLADPTKYIKPKIRWRFEGAPLRLHRIGLDRDLHYQPTLSFSEPGRATNEPFRLGPDDFFVLGDNSAASRDSRLWDTVDPWVARAVDPREGVVPRELMIGRAFFVYFPSPHDSLRRLPVPDVGRMRFIN
ncbi:MAG: S26 family signal peptidase [Planctomycetota bacterium]|nr:S26 family signal peptidase [Planctomycetota bacterium]